MLCSPATAGHSGICLTACAGAGGSGRGNGRVSRSLLERFIKVAIYFTPPPSHARGFLAMDMNKYLIPRMSKQNGSLPFRNCHEVLFAHSLLADEILCLKRQTVPATSNTRPLVGRAIWHPSRRMYSEERGREIKKLFEPRAGRAPLDDGEIQRGRRENLKRKPNKGNLSSQVVSEAMQNSAGTAAASCLIQH